MFMFDRPLFADDMGIPIDIDAEAKVSYKLCGYTGFQVGPSFPTFPYFFMKMPNYPYFFSLSYA